MTKLSKSPSLPVVRETDTFERTRPIVVELYPRYLAVRLKGTQESYSVPYDVVLDWLRKREFRRKAS
jgi:hypothetical protein